MKRGISTIIFAGVLHGSLPKRRGLPLHFRYGRLPFCHKPHSTKHKWRSPTPIRNQENKEHQALFISLPLDSILKKCYTLHPPLLQEKNTQSLSPLRPITTPALIKMRTKPIGEHTCFIPLEPKPPSGWIDKKHKAHAI